MRAFSWFLGLILLGLAAIAVLAFPAWHLLQAHFGFPFHRVASRIAMLVVLVGFVLLVRRLDLADRRSLGYALARPRFLRESAHAWLLGLATMLPVVLAMVALDMRTLRPGVELDAATLARLAAKGVISGIAVALIEETFLRGAMWTAIARESGARLATVLTALVYAATHFIGKYRIAPELVGPGSGLDMLAGAFRAFTDPMSIIDAFLCLLAVGLLLGWVRSTTGHIASCIGLHAGWVAVITVVRETSSRDEGSVWSPLLSRFDGMVGWLVLLWLVPVGVLLLRHYRRHDGAAPAP